MTHPTEEEMVLYLYHEGLDEDLVKEHVEACPSCREELDVLRGVLGQVEDAEPPERPDDYEERVWERLSRRLPAETHRPKRISWGYLVAAAAAILIASFLAGRFTATNPTNPLAPSSANTPSQLREGVLLIALGDHLEESQLLLMEVANRPSGLSETTTFERERATELLQASRLYRQTASGLGEVATADVLEELERLLLDLSHGPDSAEAQAALRSRIEEDDLLFKLRVLEANLRRDRARRAREPRAEPGAVRKF